MKENKTKMLPTSIFKKDTPSAQKKLKRLNLISQKNQFAR